MKLLLVYLNLFYLFSNLSIFDCQYFKDFTTNVYGRQPFECYRCTNKNQLTNSGKFQKAIDACGFGNQFLSKNLLVEKELCYTYCMKKEIGIVGGRIDVERRCDPSCQEYNGNTKINYLVDKISCCTGNTCNSANETIFSKFYSKNFVLFYLIKLVSKFI